MRRRPNPLCSQGRKVYLFEAFFAAFGFLSFVTLGHNLHLCYALSVYPFHSFALYVGHILTLLPFPFTFLFDTVIIRAFFVVFFAKRNSSETAVLHVVLKKIPP